MTVLDHIGITVGNLDRSIEQFGAVLEALDYERIDAGGTTFWQLDGQPEFTLMPAREPGTGPHRHGQVGWQHLAFGVASRGEVDRLHRVALEAGWTAVREPKEYPRFTDRYYASFVEDDNGIRFEFMHNPPRGAVAK